MAAPGHVYTIGHVAKMLGEDEDWLREISICLEPEDGCLWIVGIGEDGTMAFTEFGIENLQEMISIEKL